MLFITLEIYKYMCMIFPAQIRGSGEAESEGDDVKAYIAPTVAVLSRCGRIFSKKSASTAHTQLFIITPQSHHTCTHYHHCSCSLSFSLSGAL